MRGEAAAGPNAQIPVVHRRLAERVISTLSGSSRGACMYGVLGRGVSLSRDHGILQTLYHLISLNFAGTTIG